MILEMVKVIHPWFFMAVVAVLMLVIIRQDNQIYNLSNKLELTKLLNRRGQ